MEGSGVQTRVPDGRHTVPVWLRALGGVALAAIAAGMLYAVAIAVANFSRIGV
jgi:hypothetical protein